MDVGGGAKKRMVDEMGFNCGTDAIADDEIGVPMKGGCGSVELPCVEPAAPGADGEASSKCELEDDVNINCYSQLQSPTRDLKSTKEVSIPRSIFEQLKIKWGGGQKQVLEAIVTSNDGLPCFIVACILHDKLKHWKWRIVQCYEHEESTSVYAKMRHADLVRFHGNMYRWGEARATFCSVHTVLPVTPDPMDAHVVVQLS